VVQWVNVYESCGTPVSWEFCKSHGLDTSLLDHFFVRTYNTTQSYIIYHEAMLIERAKTEYSVKRLKKSSNEVIEVICLLDQMYLPGYKYVCSKLR